MRSAVPKAANESLEAHCQRIESEAAVQPMLESADYDRFTYIFNRRDGSQAFQLWPREKLHRVGTTFRTSSGE